MLLLMLLVSPGSQPPVLRVGWAEALWKHRVWVAALLDLPHPGRHFHQQSWAGSDAPRCGAFVCQCVLLLPRKGRAKLQLVSNRPPGAGVPGGPWGDSDQAEGWPQAATRALQCPSRQGLSKAPSPPWKKTTRNLWMFCGDLCCIGLTKPPSPLFTCGKTNAGGRGDDEPSLCGEDPNGKMSSGVGTVAVYPRKPPERGQPLGVLLDWVTVVSAFFDCYCTLSEVQNNAMQFWILWYTTCWRCYKSDFETWNRKKKAMSEKHHVGIILVQCSIAGY